MIGSTIISEKNPARFAAIASVDDADLQKFADFVQTHGSSYLYEFATF